MQRGRGERSRGNGDITAVIKLAVPRRQEAGVEHTHKLLSAIAVIREWVPRCLSPQHGVPFSVRAYQSQKAMTAYVFRAWSLPSRLLPLQRTRCHT